MSILADYMPVYRVRSDKTRDFGSEHETIEDACAAVAEIIRRGGVGTTASIKYELALRPVAVRAVRWRHTSTETRQHERT